MLDRLTDRTKLVLKLAKQEADYWGHDFIDGGHILIGMLKERFGVGARVLEHFGMDLKKVRELFLGPVALSRDERVDTHSLTELVAPLIPPEQVAALKAAWEKMNTGSACESPPIAASRAPGTQAAIDETMRAAFGGGPRPTEASRALEAYRLSRGLPPVLSTPDGSGVNHLTPDGPDAPHIVE